ncbi:MAG: hypothetical protein ACAI35_14330 [Candidatus Methylacidiphilales bacterium]|nr:hypothetical protein [Candidatus Methylacidiphilales bacterium]
MKVLFTALYPMWTFHYTTEMEILQGHLNNGDDVTLVQCRASLKNCEPNPKHLLYHCARCIGIQQDATAMLEGKFNIVSWPEKDPSLPWDLKTRFRDGYELRDYVYKGFDFGACVFSSLVDRTGNVYPNPRDFPEITQGLISDAYKAYTFAVNELKRGGYDCVYVFNGRFATARPWIRACEQAGVTFRTHERGGIKTYYVAENTVPHEPTQYARLIPQFWEANKHNPEIYKQGMEFYDERPRGKLSGWVSYTKNQTAGLLPEDWDDDRRNIVIFASTEGEFSGLTGLIKSRLFKSQYDGVLAICKGMEGEANTRIYLRIHPNSIREKLQWWVRPEITQLKNLTLVLPDSIVSSYAMLWKSEKVIAFTSTMGIEATYYQKPGVLANESAYRGYDAVYEPDTVEDLITCIKSTLVPKDKEKAIAYGAFWRCSGHHYKYCQEVNYYTLTFKGKRLEAGRPAHEWLGKCESRPAVSGIRKWLQDWKDKSDFEKLYKEQDGWLAESPRPAEGKLSASSCANKECCTS